MTSKATHKYVEEHEFLCRSSSHHLSLSSGALQNQASQSRASSSHSPVPTATHQHPSLRLRLLTRSRLWRPRDLWPFPAPTREEPPGALPVNGVPRSGELSPNVSQHHVLLTHLIRHQGARLQTVSPHVKKESRRAIEGDSRGERKKHTDVHKQQIRNI